MQFGVDESVSHWAKYRPDAIAVYSNWFNCSYRNLDNHVNRLALIIDRSCRGQKRIGIAAYSKIDFLAALLAVIRSKRSVVLLNTALEDSALQVNLKDTKVKTILHDRQYARLLNLLDGKKTSITIGKVRAKGNSKKSLYYASKVKRPNDEWGILFSSGTTGVPKGVERDHYSMVTENLGWCIELGLNRNSVFYVGRPIFYTGGLVLTLATLLCGGAVILNDYSNYNNTSEVWHDYQKTLKKIKVDWAFFVPDQLKSFVREIKTHRQKILACKSILTMGAPISGEEKVTVFKCLNSKIIESWGNSESLGTITDSDDIIIRPNSIGRPFVTDELFVVDDKLRFCKPNELGRIAGGAEAGFIKYANRPKETRQARKKSLIVSEDIGYIDKDGYFYVVGRVQDMVLRKGKTIFISMIEKKLAHSFPGKGILVTVLEQEKSSIELFAIIERNLVQNASELLPKLNKVLKAEERINRLFTVDKIPKLPSGKIDRVSLRELTSRMLNG